jgi:hypothetical protein|tara:strand:- start:147 stop:554 length:408 start_codon:yes stop_codon:yes gene_type:complete
MIILTYISGLMTALLAGLLVFAIRAYRKYTLLLRAHDISTELYVEIHDDIEEWMDDTDIDLNYIKAGMEDNDYANMKVISDNVEQLNQRLTVINNQTIQARDTNDKVITNLYSELHTLKKQVIHLGSDPNTISRY